MERDYPHLLVLDADGSLLVSQATGELRRGEAFQPVRVSAFLKQWVSDRRGPTVGAVTFPESLTQFHGVAAVTGKDFSRRSVDATYRNAPCTATTPNDCPKLPANWPTLGQATA
ncbi:hypothetical protein G6F24_015066 [Rhizopus arrhizus]|nr:hypothetical protein G6F24_015066 [Rhizopus arrhizus]